MHVIVTVPGSGDVTAGVGNEDCIKPLPWKRGGGSHGGWLRNSQILEQE